jgi:LuxR family maltose regulon positive regulatory protein
LFEVTNQVEPGENDLTPVLRTKLHPPRVTTRVVERPRLFERLDEGAELPLTLVSAPAGYGKSTLVASWLSATGRAAAWLSLDEGDSDLAVFLRYLLAAIDTEVPGACPETSALIRVAEPPSAAAIAGVLTNELDELDDDLTLVLDDYHLIHDVRVHELLSGLLRHPPRPLRIVVLTRADPPLPLATARRNGMLGEVRSKNLEFTTDEANALLTDSLGPDITPVVLSRLLSTTEGWPVGLRLAALTLRGQSDPEPILMRIEGSAMWAGAALVAEVLSRLPSEYQECLLRISVVDRFCARLCESLCRDGDINRLQGQSGEEFLGWLERSDLFIMALDDDNEWYRFHHLFRDLLQRRLCEHLPSDAIADLRRAAGEWFESQGFLEEALGQYLAGGHAAAAAELVRRHRHDMMNREEWARLDVWLRRLPTDFVKSDVELLVQSAWICENRYRYDEMLELLDTIEVRLAALEPDVPSNLLLGEIQALRAVRHYFAGEARAAVAAADLALDAIPADHPSQRGFALVLHGFANQMLGEFDHAVAVCLEAMQDPRIRGTTLHARILVGLCFIHWMEADLDRVIRFASELLALGREFNLQESVSFASYFLGVAHLDRGDLDDAEAAFLPEIDLEAPSNATNHWYSAFGLALAHDASGRAERAHELAAAMVSRALEIQNPALIALAEAFEAELAVRHGGLPRAQQWARSFQPTSRGIWWRFFLPELTYARVLMLASSAEERGRAQDLLENLHDQLSANHNRRLLIDVELLLAQVKHRCGDVAGARSAIEDAVDIARSSGTVRPFRDFAADLSTVLDDLPEDSPARSFIDMTTVRSVDRAIGRPGRALDLDPPTNRELDVLELLAERFTNKEIAVRLGISPATVKRHLTNLFQKLGVQRRREAVERAKERGLL